MLLTLAAENNFLSRKIALLEPGVSRLHGENAAAAREIKRYKSFLDEYCSGFAMQTALFEKLRTLSDETLDDLRECFPNFTVSGVFMSGVQGDNLSGLRNITEWLIMEDCGEKKADIAVLNELYSYLLSCINSSCKNPICMLMTVRKGDSFDEKLHCSVSGVKGGTVTEVLMQGCVSAEKG